MLKQEFLDKITAIGTCEDDVERRTLLAELSDEGAKIFDDFDEVTALNTKYMEDNERIRAANMELFLQVGQKKDQQEVKKERTGVDDTPEEKLKFEDLFDEKGGLK